MDNKLFDTKSFKKIYPFLLRKMQSFIHIPDWNQNDSSGDGFIKNRTHYSYMTKPSTIETVLFEETVLTDPGSISYGDNESLYQFTVNGFNKEFVLGETYTVILDGTVYENLICFDDQGYASLGSVYEVFDNYPFNIYKESDTLYYATSNNIDITHTLKITQNKKIEASEVVKKLDKKYVPYSTPDWNQNDETAEDYIKNRPFYDKIEIEEFINKTIDFSNEDLVNWSQTKVGYLYESINLSLVTDQEYSVIFDDILYTSVCFKEDRYNNIIIGNGAFVNDNIEDNGLPFAIGNYESGGAYAYVIVGDTNVHNIRILDTQRTIKKIDEKFLPEKYLELVLTDKVTGYDYVVSMVNGKMVYESFCSGGIDIEEYPTQMIYGVNDTLNTDGMVVIAYCEDGSVKEITNYTCSNIDSDGEVTITYVERGKEYTLNFVVDIIDELVDFYYNNNSDGTITITGWKGTLNGEPSTEMVFPNDPRIIL